MPQFVIALPRTAGDGERYKEAGYTPRFAERLTEMFGTLPPKLQRARDVQVQSCVQLLESMFTDFTLTGDVVQAIVLFDAAIDEQVLEKCALSPVAWRTSPMCNLARNITLYSEKNKVLGSTNATVFTCEETNDEIGDITDKLSALHTRRRRYFLLQIHGVDELATHVLHITPSDENRAKKRPRDAPATPSRKARKEPPQSPPPPPLFEQHYDTGNPLPGGSPNPLSPLQLPPQEEEDYAGEEDAGLVQQENLGVNARGLQVGIGNTHKLRAALVLTLASAAGLRVSGSRSAPESQWVPSNVQDLVTAARGVLERVANGDEAERRVNAFVQQCKLFAQTAQKLGVEALEVPAYISENVNDSPLDMAQISADFATKMDRRKEQHNKFVAMLHKWTILPFLDSAFVASVCIKKANVDYSDYSTEIIEPPLVRAVANHVLRKQTIKQAFKDVLLLTIEGTQKTNKPKNDVVVALRQVGWLSYACTAEDATTE